MTCEIRLRGLRKVYPDGTHALAGIDLVCPRQKTTTLVGPSGSGKSTILKIVAGLLEASEGSVQFEDRDVTWLPPEKRNIGMVFQSYALFPNMTVAENVAFGLLVRGRDATERRRRVAEALEVVQIGELAQRRIHQLSGGQQQRVALARAVVFQPDILLLDEPLSALDAKIRNELRADLAGLLRRFAITAIYVTHDQQEAMSLGDQVVVLDGGRIMQAGPPEEVYARPANAFVAGFIGSANLLPAQLEVAANGGRCIRLPFCMLQVPAADFERRWPGLRNGAVQVLCRPQDIRITDEASAQVRVTISERLFLGDRVRLSGAAAGVERLHFEAHTLCAARPGDVVPVALDVQGLHLMPAAP